MIWIWHVCAACLAALVVLSATRPLAWLAHQYGWVYTHPPTARDVIVADVPLAGGLIALVGMFAANLVSPWPATAWGITLGMFIVIVFGLMADLVSLPRWHRVAVLACASLATVIGSQALISSTGPLLGPLELSMRWVAIPLSAMFVMLIALAFRRVDRADGLCDGLAMTTAIGVLVICGLRASDGVPIDLISGVGSVATAVLGTLLALAFFTWRHKLRRVAAIYLSHAGSSILGLVSAWLLLQAQGGLGEDGIGLGTLLWLVTIPIGDLLFFALRVVFTGSPEQVQDRSHLQHLLQARHFSMAQAMRIQLGLAAGLSAAAIIAWRAGVPDSLMFYGWVAGFAVYAYFAMAYWETPTNRELYGRVKSMDPAWSATVHGSGAGQRWAQKAAPGLTVATTDCLDVAITSMGRTTTGAHASAHSTIDVGLSWGPEAYGSSRTLSRHAPGIDAAGVAALEQSCPPASLIKPTWRTVAELNAMGLQEHQTTNRSRSDEVGAAN